MRVEEEYLTQLVRHKEAGFTAVTLNVGYDRMSAEDDLRLLAHFRHWVRQHSSDFLLIETAADIEAAKRSGRLGVTFDLEGTVALGEQLSMIELYYDLGVRWMLMAYNTKNTVGGGCLEDAGLTSFGRAVLDEMLRVGMVPCCSHTGWQTARDVLNYVDGPVIFSHSNAHAVHPHRRNIPDDLAKACAASGGVIGVVGFGPFIGTRSDGGGDHSTEGFFQHLDHFVQLLGSEHVGLGLDYVFDTEECTALFKANPEVFPASAGFADEMPMVEPERLPLLVQIMIDHGYSQEAIGQILGGNHLRIARTCWR
jgi:membrane dipeptidase